MAGPQGVAGPQGLPGATGPQGPAGPTGPRGANWVGGWSDLVRYQADDAVTFEGSSYVAIAAPTMGLPPPSSEWQMVASVGATGPQGIQGLKGDKGDKGDPGTGTVNQIDTGAGLTGGPITLTGLIEIATGGVTNEMLANNSLTVTAGSGLTGGGSVALGGSVTLGAADLAGDAAGPPGANTVTALQGRPVSAAVPVDGQHMVWSAAAGAWVPTSPQVATYRYAVFNTYDMWGTWFAGNDPSLFGGVAPSTWTDGNGVASQLTSNKEMLRTLFTHKGYAGANALVVAETFPYYSSTDGRVAIALFRIKNTTAGAINWTPAVRLTAFGSWGEYASVALNGASIWNSAGANLPANSGPYTFSLSIPAGRTSTAIFVATGSYPNAPYSRALLLAFVNNSLALPAGLQFVDDLDTATGGWEQ